MSQSDTTPDMLPFDEAERWLPVVGYEGLYEVSDLGRVRSLDRFAPGRFSRGRVLKPSLAESRLTLHLCRHGISKARRVHQLVAEAFLGRCPEGLEVCHGPGGRLDNRPLNLTYGAKAKNYGPDKVRDGTTNRGEQSAVAKLTRAIVAECRTRAASGENQAALAREFGVGTGTMWNALSGKTWFVVDVAPVPRGVRGDGNGRAELTRDQAAEIRERGRAGEIHRVIAADYGVSRRTVGKIIQGLRYVGPGVAGL